MFLPMVDYIGATIDVESYELLGEALFKQLEAKKSSAKVNLSKGVSDKELIKFGNNSYEVLSSGSKGYAFILHSAYYEIRLAQYRSKKEEFFPIAVRVKSDALWSLGPFNAWNQLIEEICLVFGEVKRNRVSRMDLCCHTDSFDFDFCDMETFKGNFFNDQLYRSRRKVTGFTFGSRGSKKIYCRIYDKVTEIENSKKTWFRVIWNTKGLDSTKVWNIEFELLRGFFKEHGIDSVEDVFNRLQSIWRYCTSEHIVKTLNDATRIERSSINPSWLLLQSAFDDYDSNSLIKRKKQLNAEAQALIPGTIGNITSYAARKGIDDISKIFKTLEVEGRTYIENARKSSYEEIIDKKMATI